MSWNPRKFAKKLSKAINALDKERAAVLNDELIDYVRHADEPYWGEHANEILMQLRKKRHFDLVQKVADVFIQSGQTSAQVRRHYGQSLLDQGNLTAGISVLKELVADTQKHNPKENAEARGLLGRAYKQLYVDAKDSRSPWVVEALKQAVKHYHQTYKSNPAEYLWQGINTVALVARAQEDNICLHGYPNPRDLASQILAEIRKRGKAKSVRIWDYATAAEACISLGQFDNALKWLHKYVKNKAVDAFELASFDRQLTEVWKLEPASPPGSHILPIVRRELLTREGGSVAVRRDDFHATAFQRKVDERQLERVLGQTGVQSYRWWQKGLERARAVARIGLDVDRAAGTGFLMKGADLHDSLTDELVLLTNAHVISDEVRNAIHPDDAIITFEALTEPGKAPSEYRVKDIKWFSPPEELDTTIIGLDKPVEGIEPYPIYTRLPNANGRSRVYIIGHPEGGTLSFSFQDNRLLDHEVPLIHYRAPTEPGSSGSPVFIGQQWKLFAVHHAGDMKIQKLNGKKGTYPANEGIWIQAVIDALAKHFADQGPKETGDKS